MAILEDNLKNKDERIASTQSALHSAMQTICIVFLFMQILKLIWKYILSTMISQNCIYNLVKIGGVF